MSIKVEDLATFSKDMSAEEMKKELEKLMHSLKNELEKSKGSMESNYKEYINYLRKQYNVETIKDLVNVYKSVYDVSEFKRAVEVLFLIVGSLMLTKEELNYFLNYNDDSEAIELKDEVVIAIDFFKNLVIALNKQRKDLLERLENESKITKDEPGLEVFKIIIATMQNQ